MDLNRQHVFPVDQIRGVNRNVDLVAFIRSRYFRFCQGFKIHVGRQIATPNFVAIEVYDHAIITRNTQVQIVVA